MKSGQQLAAENVIKVTNWIAEREQLGDRNDYRRGSKINRSALTSELGIATSVITQNPTVRELVEKADRRWFGEVDQAANAASADAARDRAQRSAQRTSTDNNRLIQRIAELQAENNALRERLNGFEMQQRMIEDGDPGIAI